MNNPSVTSSNGNVSNMINGRTTAFSTPSKSADNRSTRQSSLYEMPGTTNAATATARVLIPQLSKNRLIVPPDFCSIARSVKVRHPPPQLKLNARVVYHLLLSINNA